MTSMIKAAKILSASIGRVTVRIPDDMLAAVDAECAQRIGNVSRNTWLLEAIQEKLSRAGGVINQSDSKREN